MTLPRADHIIIAAPDLTRGIDHVERLLGTRPVLGGRHRGFGTHNALLSLGGEQYLEVIAPDPEAARPERGYLFELDDMRTPRLATWTLRTESIDDVVARARAEGLDLGEIHSGGRRNPDGTVLSWRLTDPYAMLLDGCVPFLISWGDTPHPSTVAPPGGRLVDLRIEHPDAAAVKKALAVLDVDMDVRQADTACLIATIRTDRGDVTLK